MALKRQIYLDYNATTPLIASARQALIEALDIFANPSSIHTSGRQAKSLLNQARRDVAALVGAVSDGVVFTSGATEAAATLLTPHYRMGRSPLLMSHLYIGATEHPCILEGGWFSPENRTIVPVLSNGLIDLAALDFMLQNHDQERGLALVAIQYANHETGIIQPVGEIGAIVKKAGGLLITDAVQAAARERIDFTNVPADFLIISAHKMGGAKGVGAFIANGGLIMPDPLLKGGGQELGHRSGTQALPLISAFGAAAVDALTNETQKPYLLALKQKLETGLRDIAAQTVIYGEDVARLANTCFFTLPGMKAETLAIALDLEGIAVSNGSACSSGKVGASGVLRAMGVKAQEGAIRVSMGAESCEADIEDFLHILRKILSRTCPLHGKPKQQTGLICEI